MSPEANNPNVGDSKFSGEDFKLWAEELQADKQVVSDAEAIVKQPVKEVIQAAENAALGPAREAIRAAEKPGLDASTAQWQAEQDRKTRLIQVENVANGLTADGHDIFTPEEKAEFIAEDFGLWEQEMSSDSSSDTEPKKQP